MQQRIKFNFMQNLNKNNNNNKEIDIGSINNNTINDQNDTVK